MSLLRKPLAGAAMVLALALPFAAHATGDLLFLKNSPATKFNQADFKLLRGSVEKALAGPADGPEQVWNNETTGASGTVSPLPSEGGARSAAQGAQECRRLRIANAYKLNKDEGIYAFCRANSRSPWQLRP